MTHETTPEEKAELVISGCKLVCTTDKVITSKQELEEIIELLDASAFHTSDVKKEDCW